MALTDVWALVAAILLYSYVVRWNEGRSNLVELADPFFPLVPRYDTSRLVHLCLYASVVVFFWHWNDLNLHQVIWTFIAFAFARSVIILGHPFKGHHEMIPLQDPFVEWITGGSGPPLRHDLAVSGHVGTLWGMGLLLPAWQSVFFGLAVVSAIALVSSRVHYTVDVILAPMVAWSCYTVVCSHTF